MQDFITIHEHFLLAHVLHEYVGEKSYYPFNIVKAPSMWVNWVQYSYIEEFKHLWVLQKRFVNWGYFPWTYKLPSLYCISLDPRTTDMDSWPSA